MKNIEFNLNPEVAHYTHGVSVEFLDRDIDGIANSSLAIRGWLVASIGVPTKLSIFSKGFVVGSVFFDEDRPDVAIRYGVNGFDYKVGFNIRISRFSLSRYSDLEVFVELDLRDNGSLHSLLVGHISGDLVGDFNLNLNVKYKPIILPSLGRSGTTLLMSILNSHPNIICPGDYPFEFRMASYFWHTMRILSSPSNHDFSLHPDSFESENFFKSGFNPYINRDFVKLNGLNSLAHWQDVTLTNSVIKFFAATIDDYINEVVLNSSRSAISFFAEKTLLSPMNDFVMNVYSGARQIVLVRDLRDSFLSARAFNLKRGTNSFGFSGRSNEEVLADRKLHADMLVRYFRSACSNTYFVKYEDLIRNQFSTVRGICQFLDLDYDSNIVESIVNNSRSDMFKNRHATTAGQADSVERWRYGLTDEEKEFCSNAYGDFFNTFGYACS